MAFLRAFAAACVILAASPVSAQTTPQNHPSVDVFGSLPAIEDPSITPDGKFLATIQLFNGRPVARIISLAAGGPPPKALPFNDGKIVGVQWANNDRLLITAEKVEQLDSKHIFTWLRTASVDTAGGNGAVMFSDKTVVRDSNASASSVLDLSPEDKDHIYMEITDYCGAQQYCRAVYKVDVGNGHAERAMVGSAERVGAGMSQTIGFVSDGHGNVVARIDATDKPKTQHLKVRQGNAWKEILTFDAREGHALDVQGLSADGKSIVVILPDETTGTDALVAVDIASGAKSTLYVDPKYDVSGALHDHWTGRVIGVYLVEESPKFIYFDPEMKALQSGLQSAFPGQTVHAVAWDAARQKVIVAASSPRSPTAYYLLDRTSHSAMLIAQAYDKLQPTDLGEVKSYPYKASDGLDIAAFLTLPPGKQTKNLPTVILPHGGPMARDEIGFDWMAQFMANRGYAVLQPNFRGSTGYGKKFLEAGYGQWGSKMQDDVTDGVKKLIADGIADPKRICIVGWSYGGYAALAGATLTPDLYACAVGGAGVYDLRHFLGTRERDYGEDSWMIESWQHFIGDMFNDAKKLDAVSPTENADKIKAPVLLVHGTADTTVRMDQSELLQQAMKKAGKSAALVRIEGETHYLEAASSRIRFLTELEKFLKSNIGN
jgi:dipeptidyl aminopeptidase/acylaminoacyl peptidase